MPNLSSNPPPQESGDHCVDYLSPSTRTVLIIDDSEIDRLTYQRYLQSNPEQTYFLLEADSLESGLELWRSHRPAVVLIDYLLPDGDGLEFLEVMGEENSTSRSVAIMLTGQGDQRVAVRAMKLGASDYLIKADITAVSLCNRVRQLCDLRNSEAQIRAMIEAIPDLLLRVTREGKCLNYIYSRNQAGKFLPIQQHLSEVLPPDLLENQLNYIQMALATGQLQIYEHHFYKQECLTYEEIRIVAINENEVLIMVRDITDRKRAEIQLQQTNEELIRVTRLKDEFLANMSHELRTPLNAILGLSESLQEGILGYLSQEQREAIATIEESGEHLLSLINDILDLSKISAGKMELNLTKTSVKALCDSSLRFVRQQAFQKRLELKCQIPEVMSEIVVDERRIRQVLINLLSNAVKFTLEGGKVVLAIAVHNGKTWQGSATVPENVQPQETPLILSGLTQRH